MIDASNDKHFPARVQMDRNKILATCAVHKTLSESGNEFEGEWYQAGIWLGQKTKGRWLLLSQFFKTVEKIQATGSYDSLRPVENDVKRILVRQCTNLS